MYHLQSAIILTPKTVNNHIKMSAISPIHKDTIEAYDLTVPTSGTFTVANGAQLRSNFEIGPIAHVHILQKGYILEDEDGFRCLVSNNHVELGTIQRCKGQKLCVIVPATSPASWELVLISEWERIHSLQEQCECKGPMAEISSLKNFDTNHVYEIRAVNQYGKAYTVKFQYCGEFSNSSIVHVLKSSIPTVDNDPFHWTSLKEHVFGYMDPCQSAEVFKLPDHKPPVSAKRFNDSILQVYSPEELRNMQGDQQWKPARHLMSKQLLADEGSFTCRRGSSVFTVLLDTDCYDGGPDQLYIWLYLNPQPTCLFKGHVESLSHIVAATKAMAESTEAFPNRNNIMEDLIDSATELHNEITRLSTNRTERTRFKEYSNMPCSEAYPVFSKIEIAGWSFFGITMKECRVWLAHILKDFEILTTTIEDREFLV